MDNFEHSGLDQHWLIGAQQALIEELLAELVRLRTELAQAYQLIEKFSSVPADDEVIPPLPTTFDTLTYRYKTTKETDMAQYTNPDVLVDTQWLMDHLDDPMVRIIELDMTPELYHIPGAVYWNIFTDLMQPDLSMNLEPDTIGKLLSRSGISRETTVIGYGSSVCTGAILFWLLRMFGHDNVYVLDGGYQKWIAEDRPLVTEFSTFAPTQYQVSSPNTSLRVAQPEVQASLKRSDCVLLDVRTVPEFRGEIFMEKPPEGAECGGHIPGAINVDYTQTLRDDETFKSYEELHTFFVSQGITADKEVFPYCAVGGRSAFIWFVLKYLLGYPKVRNYDGSWNEWGRLPNAPIEQ